MIDELRKLSPVEGEDFLDFLDNLRFEETDDDATDEIDQSKFDQIASKLFQDYDLIGKALWSESSDFRIKAQEIATKLIIEFIEGSYGSTHALPTYVSIPMKSNSLNDMDLDSTIEYALENPGQEVRPFTFERRSSRNPVVIMLDTSYSMNGFKLLIAGLCVAILAKLVPPKDLCVVGFAKKTYFIKRFDEEVSPYFLVTRLFQIVPSGITNLSEALEKGGEQIYPFPYSSKLILLTDADPTTGKNPIPVAGKLPTLDILLFPYGNSWMGERLVLEAKKGKLYKLQSLKDVPVILSNMFKQ